jgi:hypothetical protein
MFEKRGMHIGFLVLVSIFLLLAVPLSAASRTQEAFALEPTWAKTYGGPFDDSANAVRQTSDGGYIVAGWTDSFDPEVRDAWVLKLDSAGEVEWQKSYSAIAPEGIAIIAIEETPDGGFIAGAHKTEFEPPLSDVLIIKLDSEGNVEWQKVYGEPDTHQTIKSLRLTSDGGYIIAADSENPEEPGLMISIFKLDSDGNLEWESGYDGGGSTPNSIQQTSDGGYIITAITQGFGDPPDGAFKSWILKLDSDGGVEWANVYRGGLALYAQQTSDGGYIAAGQSGPDFEAPTWVFKLESDGAVEWAKTYDSSNNPWFVDQTSDGGYIVTGNRDSSAGTGQAFMKLDSDGNIEWNKHIPTKLQNTPHSVQETSDGGYVLGGVAFGPGGFGLDPQDFWVLKVNSDGNLADCRGNLTLEIESSVEEVEVGVDEALPQIVETSSDVTDIDAMVEDTEADVTDQCSDLAYSLELFGGGLNPDGVIPGHEVRALARTNDSTVDSVTFRWSNPDGEVEREITTPVTSSTEDMFTPELAGQWIVFADFGNGQIIQKTLNVGFFVLPESPVGAIAMVAGSLAALVGFLYFRMARKPLT